MHLEEITVADLKVLFTFTLIICSVIILSIYFNYYLLAVVIFGIIMLIFSFSLFYGAPWFPAEHYVVQKMVDFANVREGDVVYDLGSGDARILIETAKQCEAKGYKNVKLIGVEINPFVLLLSKLTLKLSGFSDKIDIKWQNLFKTDLREADVIFVFLLQKTNYKLEKKLVKLKGIRIVSHLWKFRSLKLVKADKKLKVYLYQN